MPPNGPPPRRRPVTGAEAAAPARPARRPVSSRAPAPDEQTYSELPGESAGAAMLECIAGPSDGQSFTLPTDDDVEVVVGRATDIAVSIPDTSVSRRHASLRRVGGGWMVSDLGSGNGTLVNGAQVTEELAIFSGDTITIGDTELRLKDDSNSTAPRAVAPLARGSSAGTPARPSRPGAGRPDVRARLAQRGAPEADPAAKKKKFRMILLAAFGMLVVFGTLGALKKKADEQNQQQQAAAEETKKIREKLSGTFQEGKNFAAKGQWAEAKGKFEEVAAEAPDYPTLSSYLERSGKEIPNQAALSEAEKFLAENKLSDAAAELKKVTEDTTQSAKRDDLRKQLESRVQVRLNEARGAMLEGGAKLDLAKEITDDVLRMLPDMRDAKALNEQALAAIDRRDHPPVFVQTNTSKPWEPAVARYIEGDLTGALAMVDECAAKKVGRCKELSSQMRDANGLFKKLEDLDNKQLEKLLRLDKSITGGGRSKMAITAGKQAAGKFYKMAANAKAAGQWGKAYEYAQKVLDADPSNAGAQAISTEVKGKAKDLFFRAYSLKDTSPDEALPLFKDVAAMTTDQDELHTKAMNWINSIERGR